MSKKRRMPAEVKQRQAAASPDAGDQAPERVEPPANPEGGKTYRASERISFPNPDTGRERAIQKGRKVTTGELPRGSVGWLVDQGALVEVKDA